MMMDSPEGEATVDWQRFGAALALTLAVVPDNCYVVISTSENNFVQFALRDFVLTCEVSDNSYLDGASLLDFEEKSRMIADEWTPPGHNRFGGNWGIALDWPLRFSKYEHITEKFVMALHKWFGIRHPSELRIQTWSEGEGELPDVSALRFEDDEIVDARGLDDGGVLR